MGGEMTKRKVIRNMDGAIINIGEWDYVYVDEPTALLNRDGQPITKRKALNPLPEGAYEDDADIIEGWDGGLYEVGDPRSEHPAR